MKDILTRLNEKIDKDIIDKMLDIIIELDSENLTEQQCASIAAIVDMLDPPNINEAYFKKRVRRDLVKARARRREHKRKRAQKRIKMRRYRRSAKGKHTLRKAKRLGRYGRTSTGKRKRVFVGPKLPKTQRLKPMK